MHCNAYVCAFVFVELVRGNLFKIFKQNTVISTNTSNTTGHYYFLCKTDDLCSTHIHTVRRNGSRRSLIQKQYYEVNNNFFL